MHKAAIALAARLECLNTQASDGPLALFVPVDMDSKKPSVYHRGGVWTHEKSLQWLRENHTTEFRIGMLLYGLIVIDFDQRDFYPARVGE